MSFLGGGSRFIFETCKRLAQRCDVDLIVEVASGDFARRFREIDVGVHQISFLSSNHLIYWSLFPALMRLEMRRLARISGAYDALMPFHFPMNWLSSRLPVKSVQYCLEPYAFFHDKAQIESLPFLRRTSARAMGALFRRLDGEGTKSMDGVMTISNFEAGLISNAYGRKAKIVPAGVDCESFRPTRNERLSEKYSGDRVILNVTNFSSPKNTHIVVSAMVRVLEEFPNAKLLIIGSGRYNRVKRVIDLIGKLNISDKVEILDFMDDRVMPSYYSLAETVVYPVSELSTSGLVSLEALACETPVVCSNDGGSPEYVEDGRYGFTVNPKDSKSIAAKIVTLLDDRNLQRTMGKTGRRVMQAEFTWEGTAAGIWDVINAVLP